MKICLSSHENERKDRGEERREACEKRGVGILGENFSVCWSSKKTTFSRKTNASEHSRGRANGNGKEELKA